MRLVTDSGLGPPESVLGMLQRGRGDGWRGAAASSTGAELLRECVRVDPRVDRQVESRSDYYGTLATRLRLTVEDLFGSGDFADDDWLGPSVVEAMATRGAPGAAEMVARAKQHQSDGWRSGDTPVKPDNPVSAARPWPDSDAPLQQFLERRYAMPLPRAVRHRLRSTLDRPELALLRSAGRSPEHPAWGFALQGLALRGDTAAVDAAGAVLRTPEIGVRRASAYRYLTSLPASVVLPLARRWWDLDDSRNQVAYSVMGLHAEPRDLPAIQQALSVRDHYYDLCSLVDALSRLPETGPYPELDEIYLQTDYSYLRHRAVLAMVATDPDFSSRYGEECLWDCEPDVVEIATHHAPDTTAAIRRLTELHSRTSAPSN